MIPVSPAFLEQVALVAAAWLLTYLLHSTVLLGGAWIACARARRMPLRWQDRLWKLALVGGLATASVQVGLGLEPFGGRILLSPPAAQVAVDAGGAAPEIPAAQMPVEALAARSAGERAVVLPRTPLIGSVASPFLRAGPDSSEPAGHAEAGAGARRPHAPAATPARGLLAAEVAGRPWMAVLWALWLAGAAAGLFAFARALVRLRAHLAGRVALDDGPLRARLDALAKRAGVRGRIRLSASARIAAPLTHGMLRREICVPVRALRDLSASQQEAMLGHELGHAIRRDPAWLGLCWMLERVLLVQPLNRVARARLQQNAEMLCDDWAVHLTGRHLSLASCLTEVARWVVGAPPMSPGLPAPGMAGAPLTRRVERLLAAPPREVVHRERWWLALGLAGLAAVTGAAPGFAATLLGASEPEPAAEPHEDARDAPTPEPMPDTVATAAERSLAAALAELDQELMLAMSELRDLKRAVVDAGALDRFAEPLRQLEQNVHALAAQREAVQDLLPRALASLRDAQQIRPSPDPVVPSLPRNESK